MFRGDTGRQPGGGKRQHGTEVFICDIHWGPPMPEHDEIDAYDANGMTRLLYAVFSGDCAQVKSLLDQGADCNRPHRDDLTATPLWHAEEDFGLVEIAKLLRRYGAG